MNSSCHVGKLELSVLEGSDGLAKLMPTLHIVQCNICAELGTAYATAGYVDPPTSHCNDSSPASAQTQQAVPNNL